MFYHFLLSKIFRLDYESVNSPFFFLISEESAATTCEIRTSGLDPVGLCRLNPPLLYEGYHRTSSSRSVRSSRASYSCASIDPVCVWCKDPADWAPHDGKEQTIVTALACGSSLYHRKAEEMLLGPHRSKQSVYSRQKPVLELPGYPQAFEATAAQYSDRASTGFRR